MTTPDHPAIKSSLDSLVSAFFRAVSFDVGAKPSYESIAALFVERALLIKNSGPVPEIASVAEFIEPRLALVRSGTSTCFLEAEISESTVMFGNVAHRFSVYSKSGTSAGIPFEARGMISTQFVYTPAGWKMSAMAWDDERPGLVVE